MYTTLINKIKNATKIAVTAGVLYTNAILPLNAQAKPLDFEMTRDINGYISPDGKTIVLPDKLTQQTEDFYKNPEKEFDFYKRVYSCLAKDEVLNSKDIEKLEFVLEKTLEEIKDKTYDENGMLKQGIFNSETQPYFEFYKKKRTVDLQRLNEYIELEQKYKEHTAWTARFWHGGILLLLNTENHEIRIHRKQKELVQDLFHSDQFYYNLIPYHVRIEDLDLEFATKTKMPFFFGFLLSTISPFLTAFASARIRRKNINIETLTAGSFVTALLGLGTDSLHPFAYPIRVIGTNLLAGFCVRAPQPQPNHESATFIPRQGFVAPSQAQPQPIDKPKKECEVKKKIIMNGKELSEAEQEALDDIITRFKNIELD